MIKIGIVGITGIHPLDNKRLSLEHFNFVINTFEEYINKNNIIKSDIILVSNGMTWINHIIVHLYLLGGYGGIELYIPTTFDFKFKHYENTHEGRTLNRLHNEFKEKTNIDGLEDLSRIFRSQSDKKIKQNVKRGYKQCNTLMITNCDHVLMFSYDDFNNIASDLNHTWNKIKCIKEYVKIN